MRTRIRVNDKWYQPVPWITPQECEGCCFNDSGISNLCPNSISSPNNGCCDAGHEFEGYVFIPVGKKNYEEYIHKAVLHRMNSDDDSDE